MSEIDPCFMCDPSILEGHRCATGAPICEPHRLGLGLPPGHDFMGCRPGSCALPHPLPAPDESGCHWPYGNVFFGGSKTYHPGDPICMLTEAQHRRPAPERRDSDAAD